MAGLKISPEFQETIITVAVSVVSAIFMFTADHKPVEISKPSLEQVVTGIKEAATTFTAQKNLDP